MTEFQIASAIENYVTSHRGVTDFPISLGQIRDEVDSTRLRLLSDLEKANKGIVNLNPYAQNITVKVDRVGKKLVATVPYINYMDSGKLAALYVGGIISETSGTVPFKLVTFNRALWAQHDLYSGTVPTAVYNEGTFEMWNVAPKEIVIEAVFNKPSELRKYGYDWKKTPYPTPSSIVDKIIGKVVDRYLRYDRPVLPQPNTQSDINIQEGQQLKIT